jgi:hypothetical protein
MEFVTFKHGGSVAWSAHLDVSGQDRPLATLA